MYLVTIDNNILHDPRIKDYQVLNPVLNLEVNKTHSFNFTIYPSNPMFNSIERLKSIIEVYDDGELIFRGRPLNDTADFNKATTIQCEGELAYLNDSTMEPYSYFGTVRGLLELYIDNHNAQVDASKQFTLGTVNVVGDFVRSNIDYTNTWEELSTKTFGSGMGGYLRIRRENNVNYIDYLSDSPYISGQTIELSKNLLDYEKTVKASDIITVLIPLGAKFKDEEGNELDERLTIESVNSGSKFIEHTNGISKYGRIVGYKVWDDINSASLLKTRATNDLNFLVNLGISIKIKAIDLNVLDKSIPKIRFFEYVKIISKPHEIDDSMLIKKQTIHLDDPSQNTIEVGVEVSSFTDKQLEANNTIKIIKSDYVTNEKMTNVITPITVQVSQIIQQSDSIELSVSELRTDLENIELTPGPQGIPGQDGTSLYTWIKYADTPTSGMDDNPTGKKYVGFAYNQSTQTESTNYADYEWQLVKGADGLNGQPGADGKTYYNWIAYADTSSGGGISLSPTNKDYVGYAFNKETQTPSLTASDYQWQLVKGDKGDKGDQGIQGPAGTNGQSQYVHIRYSENSSGSDFVPAPTSDTKYIGIANTTSSTAPTSAGSYTWSKYAGEDGADGPQGIPGENGDDGQTTYTWVKYADTPTSGMDDFPDGKKYIGLAFNKTTQTESANYGDYQWSLMPQNITVGGSNLLINGSGELKNFTYWTFYPTNARLMFHKSLLYRKALTNYTTFDIVTNENSLSGNNLSFFANGKALNGLFRTYPDNEYGFRFKRVSGNQDFNIEIHEFNENKGYIGKQVYTFDNSETYGTINNITFESETSFFALLYDVQASFSNRLVLTEMMFNVGNPKTYEKNPDVIEESIRTEVLNRITRVETETTSKITANTEAITLERSERTTEYGTISDSVRENSRLISLNTEGIETLVEETITDIQGQINKSNLRIDSVDKSIQTFSNQITDLEGDMVEQQTFFRTGMDGLTIGGTDWETVMHANGERISFQSQTGSVQAQFGVGGMYVNRWETDFHAIEKFEEGSTKGTIHKNRKGGS